MNPYWLVSAYRAMKARVRTCPRCGRSAVYPSKKPGQFHLCKYCQHRFKEYQEKEG